MKDRTILAPPVSRRPHSTRAGSATASTIASIGFGMSGAPRETSASEDTAQAAKLALGRIGRRGASISDETVRVLIVDDHAMFREGLRALLRTAPDIAVIGEAENGAAAVAVAQRLKPDVVILDLDMPGSDGAFALRELQKMLPALRILILTMHRAQDRLLPLLEGGAWGYLTKDSAAHELVDAIRIVAAGEVYVPPSAARMLAATVVPQRAAQTARGQLKKLSDRERSILQMVARGYSGAEIARLLGISSKTVDAYKRRVQDKLGLTHRTHYVRFAVEAGLLGE